jgi:serine/threonine protein kinase
VCVCVCVCVYIRTCTYFLAGENQDSTRAIAGTRYWMAPELLRRESLHKAGTAADMWSLGVTAIELANGSPPYFDEAPMTAVRYILRNDPPILQGKVSSVLVPGRISLSLFCFLLPVVFSCVRSFV